MAAGWSIAGLDPFPHSVGVFSGGAGAEHHGPWSGALDIARRYEAYCSDQARALVQLVPREAIRPLLRSAHAWAEGAEVGSAGDPMDLLVGYLRTILPLPPIEVWLDDLRRAPIDHLECILPARAGDIRRSPVAVAVRDLDVGGAPSPWVAVLLVFPEAGAPRWRGFVAFGEAPDRLDHRTADIFQEYEPRAIRDGFLETDEETLRGYLRSASV